MKIQPRTTYLNGNGNRVMIAGPTRDHGNFWSIGGDHYTEAGLFVFSKKVSREPLVLEYFTVPESPQNLVKIADVKPGEWDGVQV